MSSASTSGGLPRGGLRATFHAAVSRVGTRGSAGCDDTHRTSAASCRRNDARRLRHADVFSICAAALAWSRPDQHGRVGAGDYAVRAAGLVARGSPTMMHVWSVIPALNESSGIAAVVAGVRPYVQRVIVVDDGSS